jgi:small-conductance mechanosensitive channel
VAGAFFSGLLLAAAEGIEMKLELLFGGKWLAALAVVLIAAMAHNAYACATCGLAGDPGYTASVIFMMAVPYSIFLIGSVVAFFAYRNACRRRNAEENASQPVPNR